jgi:hypothetical protein
VGDVRDQADSLRRHALLRESRTLGRINTL